MTISKEEFQKEVRAALEAAVSDLSKEARLEKVDALLEKAEATVTELLETIELKDQNITKSTDENKSLKEQVEELVAKTKEIEERLAAREAELKDAQDKALAAEERAATAETELAKIALDRRLELRVTELAEAKVLKSGEKADAQKAKIREMSDEDFSAYKDELVDLRLAVEASLKEAATTVEVEVETEETVEVAPPQINREDAALAALDTENNDAGKSRYSDFGSALAKRLRK